MNQTQLIRRVLVLFIAAAMPWAAAAQTVQKLADLTTGQDFNGNGYGPSAPECHFTVIGTNLLFTSNLGGAAGAGGVFTFDPSSSNVTQVGTFDNNSGKNPQASSILVANNQGWFTTSLGGTGNKGSLCTIDLTNYTVNNVFNFPTNAALGWSPHSTPIQIGEDLWFTTSSGGTPPDGSTTYGAIVKYSLTSGQLSNMFSLDGTNSGRQPLGNSLVKAGSSYYYLTFAGGTNTAGGTPNGAGILGRLSFDPVNQPVLTKVVDLPGRAVAFPAGDPVFDGTNFLYFTTVGVSTNPGAIARFDISNNSLTTLFNFVSNTVAVTNFGKQPYGTPVLYDNELYFTTFGGGTAGKGVVAKLSLSNNLVTKLADLEGATNLALGATPQYNGGTVFTNPADSRIGIYLPINKGGLNNNNGTILRILMPPPPIVATLQSTNGGWQLSWTGGYPPFSVDAKAETLGGGWATNWLSGLTTNSVRLTLTNNGAYFRIAGASQ